MGGLLFADRLVLDALYSYLIFSASDASESAGRARLALRSRGRNAKDETHDAHVSTARAVATSHTRDPRLAALRNVDEAHARSTFDALFRETYAALVRFAAQYVGGTAAAEDVVSDVFVTLWANRASVAPRGSLDAYLFGAVRQRAISAYRQQRRRGRVAPILADGEYWGMGAPPEPADAGAIHADHRTVIWRAIAELPERQREVLALRWQAGLDWPDIARVLESTSAAVQMQHSRAARVLRERLAQYFV